MSSLAVVDELPPKCSLAVEMDGDPEAGILKARFQAIRNEDHPDGPAGSRWSAWFDIEDDPIPIMWSAFRWED